METKATDSPVLSSRKLRSNTLPLRWKPVLEKISEFYDVLSKSKKAGSEEEKMDHGKRLRALHDSLLGSSQQLLEQDSLSDFSEEQLKFLTAKSLLLLTRFEQSAGMEFEMVDTFGSKTLTEYNPDLSAASINKSDLEGLIEKKLGISRSDLDKVRVDLSQVDAEIDLKKRIMAALCQVFGLSVNTSKGSEEVFGLFSAFYPNSGFRPGDVEVVITGASVFFCLKFCEKSKKPEPDWFGEASQEEVSKAQEFIDRLTSFQQKQFAHFPVFGFFDGNTVAPDLLTKLSELAGCRISEVASELTTSVTILPYKDVEKYILHDVWGHGWQSGLVCFGDMYKEIAGYGSPLTLDEEAQCPVEGRFKFVDCFRIEDGAVHFLPDVFAEFVDAEVSERLPVSLSPVLAEILADVVEYKAIEEKPELKKDMPSSSFFASMPSKLDLTLNDIKFYFRQSTKVFRKWASGKRTQQVVEELVKKGAAAGSASTAVQEAVDEWLRLEKEFYLPKIEYSGKDGSLQTNAFSKIALNFVGLHRQLYYCYNEIAELKPSALDLHGFKDLLIIAASVFFEMNRRENIWKLDEFLALKFVPICKKIGVVE